MTIKPQVTYLKDYTVPNYLIEKAVLNFELDANKTKVKSELSIKKNPQDQRSDTALILHGEELTLVSISLNGNRLTDAQYQQTAGTLTIAHVPQDVVFTLVIENTINPAKNTALEGLYLSNNLLCTQCEAEGFRRITYFLDRPDVMTRFKTTLVADREQYPVLLSNGNKVAKGLLPGNKHWVSWEDPFSKPCYLFALVAGQLEYIEDSFVTASNRQVLLQIYVESADLDQCDHAMQSLKKAMRWDEEHYGREYDLDLYMIVAVSHFNMGAMENKGLNIFNTKFVLARTDTATDDDYEHIEGVIAHEYFHNWTGNRITCRDWFQLSLKEGFTVFRDQQFTADQTSKAVKRIDDVKLLRSRQFVEDAGPLAHPVRPESYIEINNFYTLTVYEKGAEIVRMLHTLLGEQGFRKGSDWYFQHYDGQAVTCEDFILAMEAANAADLTLFRRWYRQVGTPVLEVTEDYEQQREELKLTLRQSYLSTPDQVIEPPLHIPVKIALINADGSQAKVIIDEYKPGNEVVLSLTDQEQIFICKKLPSRPVVSLLRGFSAPVILKQAQTLEQLAFLLRHDSDSFNRWEAGQILATKIILGLVDDIQCRRKLVVNPLLIESFSDLLKSDSGDLSYLSLLLHLPEENYLAGQMRVVDVDAIYQAREFVKQRLAISLYKLFLSLYQRHHKTETRTPDVQTIGCRRIKNTCLMYLMCQETAQSYRLAEQQFESATNMTDQIAAITAIINSHHPSKSAYVQRFFQQWQNQALVIDKWFTVQACSRSTDTFETVKALIQHPSFDLNNPNRVRSLIGAFAQANPIHFHHQTGRGYAFLAEKVIALDRINPQIASRMVIPLTQWQRFDSHRQHLMKDELRRIVASKDLSKDVFELVTKSLD